MQINTWIKNELSKNGLDKQKLYSEYSKFVEETQSSLSLNNFKRKVRMCFNELDVSHTLEVNDEEIIKLEATRQSLQDKNNYVRKLNRESFRVYNTLEALFQEYTDLLKKVDLSRFQIKEHKSEKSLKYMVIQLSDTHFNEWIEPTDSNGNEYNFDIAAKRMKKFVSECIRISKVYNVKDVYLLITGDLINSNRRWSEKLSQITSQVRASLLATHLISQAILELTQYFNVNVSFVCGNESRITDLEGMENGDFLASENWDYLIFHNLEMMFRDKKVKFILPKNSIKNVVRLPNGFNILLTHGHLIKGATLTEKSIAMVLQEYLYQGTPIHMVLSGHIHSASIGDILSRSSSLVGANSYSSQNLGFMSRASQNCYIINEDKGFHGFKIDLQNVDAIEGYHIDEELERYNIHQRSASVRIIQEVLA